jgi:hypothetical protein
MAKRTTKRSKARATAQPELTVRTFELTAGETPLLTLECPDLSSGKFTLTFSGTYVTAGASTARGRARKR